MMRETQLDLFGDATPKGWGRHLEWQEVDGLWAPAECLLHINVLELHAALRTLQHFCTQIQGKVILLSMDNAAAVLLYPTFGSSWVPAPRNSCT